MKKFRQQYRPKKSFLIPGLDAVIEAIQAGKQLDRIYIQADLRGTDIQRIKSLAAQHRIPVNKVPVEKLNGFNIRDHRGIVAMLARVHYYELQAMISFIVEKGETPLLLLLDGITDIRNVGAIARTAFCFGAQALVIPDKGVGSLNDDAVLTSAGALETLPVCRVNSLLKAVDELHLNGIRVLASDAKASGSVMACDFREPCAIVLGSEEKGIHPAVAKQCDEKFKIPMTGEFESLNVGVAAGMILYEVMRQRVANGN